MKVNTPCPVHVHLCIYVSTVSAILIELYGFFSVSIEASAADANTATYAVVTKNRTTKGTSPDIVFLCFNFTLRTILLNVKNRPQQACNSKAFWVTRHIHCICNWVNQLTCLEFIIWFRNSLPCTLMLITAGVQRYYVTNRKSSNISKQ